MRASPRLLAAVAATCCLTLSTFVGTAANASSLAGLTAPEAVLLADDLASVGLSSGTALTGAATAGGAAADLGAGTLGVAAAADAASSDLSLETAVTLGTGAIGAGGALMYLHGMGGETVHAGSSFVPIAGQSLPSGYWPMECSGLTGFGYNTTLNTACQGAGVSISAAFKPGVSGSTGSPPSPGYGNGAYLQVTVQASQNIDTSQSHAWAECWATNGSTSGTMTTGSALYLTYASGAYTLTGYSTCPGGGYAAGMQVILYGSSSNNYAAHDPAKAHFAANDAAPATPGAETSTVTSTITCRNASGSDTNVTSSGTVTIAPGTDFTVPKVSCPTGTILVKGGATITRPNGSTTTLVPQTPAPKWVQDMPTDYPNCVATACLLQLHRLGTDGVTRDCLSSTAGWNSACTGWAADPQRTSTYSCTYGTYSVALDFCKVYVNYPTGQATPTLDPTDPTSKAPPPIGDPAANTPKDDCFPSGYAAFNPIEWVEVPVKCALKWAFVPSEAAVESSLQTVKTPTDRVLNGPDGPQAVGTGILGPFVTAFKDGVSGDGSDCLGWKLEFDTPTVGSTAYHLGPIYPFAACIEPTKTLSDLCLGLENFAIYAALVFYSWNKIGRALGGFDGPYGATAGSPM